MYAFTGFSENEAVMVFCFNDNDRAVDVLGKIGVKLLDVEAFDILESGSLGNQVED